MRKKILRKIYQMAPFDIRGDFDGAKTNIEEDVVSCLVCTVGRDEQLEALLDDLSRQTLDRNKFEIIVLDDSPQGARAPVDKYSNCLAIQYLRNAGQRGMIGALRNETLRRARGEFILFLDDDTRIPDANFLVEAVRLFKDTDAEVILPKGKALPRVGNSKYDFLDSYSFANRCCLYRQAMLQRLGGFRDDLAAYEDVELGLRVTMAGGNIIESAELGYCHPPLYFDSLRKPLCIGQSILRLRRHYSLRIWLMIYFNALRFLPLGLIPFKRNRQWFKISWGVLMAPFIKNRYYY